MKLLITGGSGQLALALERRFSRANSGHTVVRLSRAELDISSRSDCQRIANEVRPDVVLNCAAYTAVDRAESDADAAFAINAAGAGFIAEAARSVNARMVHFSTDYVFDGTSERPYVETDTCAPLSVYGASKLAGETAVFEADPSAVVLRLSWVYSNDGANFYKTMLRLGSERPELRVVADQQGIPNFTGELADAVATLVAANSEKHEQQRGLYHLSAAGVTTWHAFASEIVARAKLKQPPAVTAIATRDFPTPAKRPAMSALNSARFAEAFAWQPPNWISGLDRCLAERGASA
ncbi:MAG: dTDP-4-dehydrorhamnose reductase [Betaproteobacteria bacterium]|nr:MAG: dTDP-4-dehydrorhamnose reductase [Betaproteobacteria bacterium]